MADAVYQGGLSFLLFLLDVDLTRSNLAFRWVHKNYLHPIVDAECLRVRLDKAIGALYVVKLYTLHYIIFQARKP